jgi:putative ABC transport system permease protein
MISIFSTLRIALRALWVNKMRSALTMLGIIIGVSAVIIMLAVGTGVSRKISSQISSIGSNLIIIMPGSTTQGGVRMGGGSQSTLTTGDAEAILRECSAVAAVAPMQFGTAQVVFGNQNWSTGIQGTTPGILEVKDCGLSAGRNMSDQDIRSATKVCFWDRRLWIIFSAVWIRSVRSSAQENSLYGHRGARIQRTVSGRSGSG